MKHWLQDLVLEAWNYAAVAHGDQCVPGSDLPYLRHVGSVAMEVMSAIVRSDGTVANPDLALCCAVLHDVIEDTGVTCEVLDERFGASVAAGVQALTKDDRLPTKRAQLLDSLDRIERQPIEVWMVKMADRIVNLQPPPPQWTVEQIGRYREEAELILERLEDANRPLADRLGEKIGRYPSNRIAQ